MFIRSVLSPALCTGSFPAPRGGRVSTPPRPVYELYHVL